MLKSDMMGNFKSYIHLFPFSHQINRELQYPDLQTVFIYFNLCLISKKRNKNLCFGDLLGSRYYQTY